MSVVGSCRPSRPNLRARAALQRRFAGVFARAAATSASTSKSRRRRRSSRVVRADGGVARSFPSRASPPPPPRAAPDASAPTSRLPAAAVVATPQNILLGVGVRSPIDARLEPTVVPSRPRPMTKPRARSALDDGDASAAAPSRRDVVAARRRRRNRPARTLGAGGPASPRADALRPTQRTRRRSRLVGRVGARGASWSPRDPVVVVEAVTVSWLAGSGRASGSRLVQRSARVGAVVVRVLRVRLAELFDEGADGGSGRAAELGRVGESLAARTRVAPAGDARRTRGVVAGHPRLRREFPLHLLRELGERLVREARPTGAKEGRRTPLPRRGPRPRPHRLRPDDAGTRPDASPGRRTSERRGARRRTRRVDRRAPTQRPFPAVGIRPARTRPTPAASCTAPRRSAPPRDATRSHER